MREDIAGRANVEDTEELKAYYEELAGLQTGALWTVANEIEPWFPKSTSVPMLWRYLDLRAHVLRSLELVSPEKAGRRVVYLCNPNRREVSAAVGWLYTGLQVMNPGEVASAHRHSASALRFIMEGTGAYTVVDGHRITLGPRDFVLTPNGTWHDHGVDADGTQCVWQDGLDIPLMNSLDANFYEVHPEIVQKPGNPLPREGWSRPYSPVFRYPFDEAYAALKKGNTSFREYTNPITGGPVMPTMGARLELVRGETRPLRHTGSVIYQVATGRGHSMVGGQRFDWEEKDIFCVPAWTAYSHASAEESCLFSFNDFPAMKALGLYREELVPG